MPAARDASLSEIREAIEDHVPSWMDPDEAAAGVALAQLPPSERTLPLVELPFRTDVAYAWSDEDASVAKLALDLLAHLGKGLLAGKAGLLNLGFAVKDVVAFTIDLRRTAVRLEDPLQIRALALLRRAPNGLSSKELRRKLGADEVTIGELDAALEALASAEAARSPRPLVRSDDLVWKSLV